MEQNRLDEQHRSIMKTAFNADSYPLSAFDDNEPDWEEQARRVVESALEHIKFDEIRKSVLLLSGEDHRFNRTLEEFTRIEDLQRKLVDKAEAEWINYVPYDKWPVFEPNVEAMVQDLLERSKIVEFFDPPAVPLDGDELFSAKDFVVPAGGILLRIDLEKINEELIRYLASHPEAMREMHPRKFEELVAELFRHKGYEVELTPPTRDGGFDIRAYYRSDTGTFLTLIECKRYGAHKPVSVDIVRGLYGVVTNARATRGLVATTSTFTKDAKAFQAQNEYQLHLADYSIIQNWLADFKAKSIARG